MLGLLALYKGQYALGLSLGLAMVVLEMQSPKFMETLVNHVTAYVADADPNSVAARSSFVSRSVGRIISTIRHESPLASPRSATMTVVVTVALWALVLA